jgi:hypothetical protein
LKRILLIVILVLSSTTWSQTDTLKSGWTLCYRGAQSSAKTTINVILLLRSNYDYQLRIIYRIKENCSLESGEMMSEGQWKLGDHMIMFFEKSTKPDGVSPFNEIDQTKTVKLNDSQESIIAGNQPSHFLIYKKEKKHGRRIWFSLRHECLNETWKKGYIKL